MFAVSADLFDYGGNTYLVLVDRFSGFSFVRRLMSVRTSDVTKCLLEWFMDWGIPNSIRTDGGPQFRTEFETFCSRNGIEHEVSSPYHSQSNGLAEAAVKQTKYLLIKCEGKMEEFKRALAEWRNTPRADGYSPAQMFIGRRQRGLLPTLPNALEPINLEDAHAARTETSDKGKEYFDRSAVDAEPLKQGQKVHVQNPKTNRWDRSAVVVSVRSQGRSYVIRDANGKFFTRNRKLLRIAHNENPVSQGEEHERTHEHSKPKPILRRSNRIREKRHIRFN